ncbi:MAG: alkaline phosphatase family protein [Rhodospirillaceae bacterium]
MAPTAFILLDACRGEYLERGRTPFLERLADEAFFAERVRPTFGFCERSEILTGRDAVTAGFFTAIGYAPDVSPFREWEGRLRLLGSIAEALPGPMCRAFDKVVRAWLRGAGFAMKPYRIPIAWLPRFALTEDRFAPNDPRAYGGGSLLGVAEELGKRIDLTPFTYLGAPDGLDDDGRLQLAAARLDRDEVDLVFVYVSELDSVGHRFGPDSAAMNTSLEAVDAKLARWVKARGEGVNVIVVGDHGMHAVHDSVDVTPVLSAIASGSDGIRGPCWWFVDSTMIRFWSEDRSDTDRITQLCDRWVAQGSGRLLTPQELERIDPGRERVFGDVIFVCHPRWVLSPDFFRGASVPAGMHGYEPHHDDEKGVCIARGPDIVPDRIDEMPLTDLHRLLLACFTR